MAKDTATRPKIMYRLMIATPTIDQKGATYENFGMIYWFVPSEKLVYDREIIKRKISSERISAAISMLVI
jgi:hypothetical protein